MIGTASNRPYKIMYALGEGNQGSVYCAQHTLTGEYYAIKRLDISDHYKKQFIQKEISIHKLMSHPNVVRYIESYQEGNHLYVVMELGECSLTKFLETKPDRSLSEAETIRVLKDVCEGLKYVHSKGVIHRDIKVDNIIQTNGNFKIADFGVSAKGVKSTRFVGTPIYLAPQIITNRVYNDLYDKTVDIWSLGILAFEVYFKVNPFYIHTNLNSGKDQYEMLLDNILKICTPNFDIRVVIENLMANGLLKEADFILKKLQNTSKHLMHILKKMFQVVPENRITLDGVLQLLNVMENVEIKKIKYEDPNLDKYYYHSQMQPTMTQPQLHKAFSYSGPGTVPVVQSATYTPGYNNQAQGGFGNTTQQLFGLQNFTMPMGRFV